jgi:hypothetical protein
MEALIELGPTLALKIDYPRSLEEMSACHRNDD